MLFVELPSTIKIFILTGPTTQLYDVMLSVPRLSYGKLTSRGLTDAYKTRILTYIYYKRLQVNQSAKCVLNLTTQRSPVLSTIR